jgi:hypothetical protein
MSVVRVNQIQDTSTNVAANISGGVVTFTNPPVGTGKVLQVVNATSTSQLIFTNTSFVAFNLNLSITPTHASSKILVSFSVPVYISNAGNHGIATIFRETGTASQDAVIQGTNLGHSSWGFGMSHGTDNGHTTVVSNGAGVFDSPGTTNAVRYTIAGRRHNDHSNNHIYFCINGTMALITLMEIGA